MALVGPSGAGKSTIIKLLPRFFDVTSGQILIDGQIISDVTVEVAPRHGLGQPRCILFDDTVAANIGFGKAGASQDEIETAAKGAAAHDFIMALPGGYEHLLGPWVTDYQVGNASVFQLPCLAERCSYPAS